MTKKNDITIPVDYETAQRFIADFHFLCDYREKYSDDYNNNSSSPVYRDVFIASATSLLESSEILLDKLFDAFPAEFMGYCSDKPQRCLKSSEKKRLKNYLKN